MIDPFWTLHDTYYIINKKISLFLRFLFYATIIINENLRYKTRDKLFCQSKQDLH